MMKKHLVHLACVGVLFLFCVGAASGQPGCRPIFNAEEACAWPIQSSEYVFLGRVVSVEAGEGALYRPNKKFVVEVEASLKGSLPRRIDLTVTDDCLGMARTGQRHIFTAGSVAKGENTELVSEHWSTSIHEEYPKRELDALLSEIRAVINKVKQPRLVGAVVEKGRYPDGRWLRLASGRYGKLGYDKILDGGHADVVVTARRKDALEFRTATGVGGYFVFNDLPHGMYEVFADLPEGYNVRSEGTFHTYEGDRKFLQIDDGVCSKKITFSVQLQGGVKVRIRGVRKDWSHVIVHLFRVVRASGGKRELVESLWDRPAVSSPSANASEQELEHVFKEVPIGDYVVMLSITTHPNVASTALYYPGTSDPDRAGVIGVEPAKTKSIDITIPGSVGNSEQ